MAEFNQPLQDPEGDPLLGPIEEMMRTMGVGDVAGADGPSAEDAAAAEVVARHDPIHLRFRGEEVPIPMVRDREALGEVIAAQCPRGLAALMAEYSDDPDVEFAGYALTTYTFPQDRLDFGDPAAAEALKLALLGAGMAVESGPRPNQQDFWLELGDCFDVRALARGVPEVWGTTVWRQSAFPKYGFILAPTVRFRTDGYADNDEYNQPGNIIFDTDHAVYIPGDVLLQDLLEADPRLREGFAIERGLPAEHLTRKYDLQPANEKFREEWIARRDAWFAEQAEQAIRDAQQDEP
jgi:hypothetical protein